MKKTCVLKDDETPHDYRIKLEPAEIKLIKQFKPKKILEVCAGNGKNAIGFANAGYDVTCIESNKKLLKKFKQELKKSKTNLKIIEHPIFAKKFPFKDGEFDFIYSYQYLNHNFKDKIEEVFSEIYRTLKKGGLFSLKITDVEQLNFKHVKGDIYEECDPEFPSIKYRKLAEQTFTKLEGDEKDIPHYGYKLDELKKALIKKGFKIINIRKIRWNLVVNLTK